MNDSAPFDLLHQAYLQRHAAAASVREHGQCVVGFVGNTVPVEIIIAAGATALRVAPIEGDTTLADRYVETFSDLDARLIFAQFNAGELDALDLLIIPRSTETQHKLFLALREARRIGLCHGGPELWLYDILHTQRPSSRAYGLARTQELAHRLALLGGRPIDDVNLRSAIALTNETRALLLALQERRAAGAISGWQAQVASGATRFMAPQQANAALRRWLDAGGHSACHGPRLLVKGVPLDHAELHAMAERCGACIVLEDDDWGTRAAAPLISTTLPPLEAIFDHYYRGVPCPRLHPADAGGNWFTDAVRQRRFDGVLFYLPRPDDIHGWSFPADRDIADQAGLPWLLIRDDARSPSHRDALAAALASFIAERVPQ